MCCVVTEFVYDNTIILFNFIVSSYFQNIHLHASYVVDDFVTYHLDFRESLFSKLLLLLLLVLLLLLLLLVLLFCCYY